MRRPRFHRDDFSWGNSQHQSFNRAKKMLQSHSVLVHFDPSKEIVLSCDASPYGVGSVLAHVMSDGIERLIAYHSRSLAPAEKNYSQLNKEALSIICVVKRFYQYIYGSKIKILTDHKPLIGMFCQNKVIPHMASSRIQRWCLSLSACIYIFIRTYFLQSSTQYMQLYTNRIYKRIIILLKYMNKMSSVMNDN